MKPATFSEAVTAFGRALDAALGLSRFVAWLNREIERRPRLARLLERLPG